MAVGPPEPAQATESTSGTLARARTARRSVMGSTEMEMSTSPAGFDPARPGQDPLRRCFEGVSPLPSRFLDEAFLTFFDLYAREKKRQVPLTETRGWVELCTGAYGTIPKFSQHASQHTLNPSQRDRPLPLNGCYSAGRT